MTVEELHNTMPAHEFVLWQAYIKRKNEREAKQREQAQLEAKAQQNLSHAKRM